MTADWLIGDKGPRSAGRSEEMLIVNVMGVPIAKLDHRDAISSIGRLIAGNKPTFMAFANAHTVNLAVADQRYGEVLEDADLVLRDGIGVGLAGAMIGQKFPENLNGSDFMPDLLRFIADEGWTVFVLGGAEGVASRAVARLRREIPHLLVVGSASGTFRISEEPKVVQEVRDSGAEVLVVALGNPLQEQFLARHLASLGVRFGVGVGAFLDFYVGDVQRAPERANTLGVEWLYRLAREPRRMWRRYVIGNPMFLARCVRALLVERRHARSLRKNAL